MSAARGHEGEARAGEQRPGGRRGDLAGDQLARGGARVLRVEGAGRRSGSWPWRRCGPPPPPAPPGRSRSGSSRASPATSTTAATAKGRAKSEWENFTIRATAPTVMRRTSGRWRASHSKAAGRPLASRSQAKGSSGATPPSGAARTPGAEPGASRPTAGRPHRGAVPGQRQQARGRRPRGRPACSTASSSSGESDGEEASESVPTASGMPAASSRGRSGSRPEMCRLERGQRTTVAPERRSAARSSVVEVHRVDHQRLRPEPGGDRRPPADRAKGRSAPGSRPSRSASSAKGPAASATNAPLGRDLGEVDRGRPGAEQLARPRPGGWSRRRAGSGPRAARGRGRRRGRARRRRRASPRPREPSVKPKISWKSGPGDPRRGPGGASEPRLLVTSPTAATPASRSAAAPRAMPASTAPPRGARGPRAPRSRGRARRPPGTCAGQVGELEVEVGVHQRRQEHRVEPLGRAVARLDLGARADLHHHVAVERHRAVARTGGGVRSGEHPGRGDDADGHGRS